MPALALSMLALLMMSGCANLGGRWVAASPNQGRTVAQCAPAHDAAPAMQGAVIDHRFRVEVAEPPASLSVWIIDPSNERVIKTSDGLGFQTPDPDRRVTREPDHTVLILHGFRHPKNSWPYLFWARVFAQNGARAVLVDLRGHGGSSGDWHTFGPGEAQDLTRVIDHLETRGLLTGRLGVFGASFGGATAMHLAACDPRVGAVVSVSAFASMREALPAFARGRLGRLGGLTRLWNFDRLIAHAGRYGDFDPDAADGRRALQNTHTPVLIAHSSNDQHIPVAQAHALAQAGGERTQLLILDGPGHFQFGADGAVQLRQAALDWFQQHLR